MIVNFEWEDFHLRFFLENMIFVKEHSDSFEFITHNNGPIVLRCVKYKHENDEENIVFIERYLTDKKNLVKVLNFDNYEEPVENILEELNYDI